MMRVKFFASNDIRRLSSRLCYSTATTKTKPVAEIVTGYKEKPSVSEIKADYIGVPDDLSNIRPILRHIPANETKLEKRLRLKRLETENFVSGFWKNHNQRFLSEKNSFINENKTHPEEILDADKMSVFYKSFLDKNWDSHFYFNIAWYLKNFEVTFLALQVNIEKGLRKVLRK